MFFCKTLDSVTTDVTHFAHIFRTVIYLFMVVVGVHMTTIIIYTLLRIAFYPSPVIYLSYCRSLSTKAYVELKHCDVRILQ